MFPPALGAASLLCRVTWDAFGILKADFIILFFLLLVDHVLLFCRSYEMKTHNNFEI